MKGLIISELNQIYNPKGDILHALKKSDSSFNNFGEAYFSTINEGDIKGWKKHAKMILNLVVVTGEVEFIVFNGEDFFSVKLSKDNYQRLTVQPGLWLAFKGLSEKNMLLNLASIEHNPSESKTVELHVFDYFRDN